MEDIVKVTKSLITNIFKKVKEALNTKADKTDLDKKADKNDVVLIEQIGEVFGVAPLDGNYKVPRENISENGWGILEIREFVSDITYEFSSIGNFDYIVYDTSQKMFLAHNPSDDKFYGNWITSNDYRNNATNSTRQDRIFLDAQNNTFLRWNGTEFVQVCLPLGTTANTAFSGADGNSLKTTVNNHEDRIIRAALAGKHITSGRSLTSIATTYIYQYDICYIVVGANQGYYYYNAGSWNKISLSSLTATPEYFKFPCRIAPANLAHTPFNDTVDMISSVYKGEVADSFVKWYIILKADTEDETYTAGKTPADSYYGSYDYKVDGYNKPWELWLPLSTAKQSVYINWQ